MEEENIKFKKTILYSNFYNQELEIKTELRKADTNIINCNKCINNTENLILKLKKQQNNKYFIFKNKIFKFLTFGCLNINKKMIKTIKQEEKKIHKFKIKLNRLKYYRFQVESELNNIKDIIKDQKLKIEELKKQELFENNNSSTNVYKSSSLKM